MVATSGAFDLLHPGHVRLLEQARPLGDILIVIVEGGAPERALAASESAAKQARPVTPLDERAEILAALAAVDFVVALDKPDNAPAADFLRQLQPDIYVQGGSPNDSNIGASESSLRGAPSAGSRVVNFPLEPGYSTAQLIQRIQHLKQ